MLQNCTRNDVAAKVVVSVRKKIKKLMLIVLRGLELVVVQTTLLELRSDDTTYENIQYVIV